MADVTAEQVKMYRNVNIVSYAVGIPGLIIWLLVLARILYYQAKMWSLILICVLMILFWIAVVVTYQEEYLRYLRVY